MNEEILVLERESDAPAEWRNNVIYERDGRGRVVEVVVHDDEEVDENAAND